MLDAARWWWRTFGPECGVLGALGFVFQMIIAILIFAPPLAWVFDLWVEYWVPR